MNLQSKARVFYIISLICSIWFLLFGWCWIYLANLVIAYPFGISAFALWLYARKLDPENKLNRICIRIILTGLFLSIMTFFMFQ